MSAPPAGGGAPAKGLFRAAALERLSTPERLDELMTIVTRKDAIAIACAALVVIAAGVWGVLGRIPVTASGPAVLVRPRAVRAVQSPGGGVLATLAVRVGAQVQRGDELATIDLYELRAQREATRAALARLEADRAAAVRVEEQITASERAADAERRGYLEERVREVQQLAERQRKLDLEAVDTERQSLGRQLATARELLTAATDRVKAYRDLQRSGSLSLERVDEAERQRAAEANRVLELEGRLQAAPSKVADAERAYQERLDRAAQLREQLQGLALAARRAEQRRLERETTYARERAELKVKLEGLDVSLERQGRVLSDVDGRVLELSVAPGQQVAPGARLALIEEGDPTRELVAVAFLAVKDGKRAAPGCAARVEPSTVQRERYGGIVGRVSEVSVFPVSREAAASVIGSGDVARSVLKDDEARIQVTVALATDPETKSGYAWTMSRGPALAVSTGTTCQVTLVLEERAPITFVLPYLRGLLAP